MDERVDAVRRTWHGYRVNRRPPPPRQDRTARGLLRRQRDLPLPRAGLRRAVFDVLGVAWMRIAVGRGDLRAVTRPPVAQPGAAAHDVKLLLVWGTVLAVMNSTLLPGHRPAAARHRRGDRVPPGDRPRRARRADAAQRWRALALAVPGVYLLTDVALDGEPLGVALRLRQRRALRRSTSCVSHRAAQNGSVPGIDLLGMAMLIAAVVVTPIGGVGRGARLLRPGRDRGRDRRRRSRPRSSPTSPTSWRWRACRARPTRSWSRCCPRRRRSSASSSSRSCPSAVEAIGVALVIAGVAVHRDAGTA